MRSPAYGSTTMPGAVGGERRARMAGGGDRVAQVVQGVEERDEVVALAGVAVGAARPRSVTRSATPGLGARAARAVAIDSAWMSKPANVDARERLRP